MARAAIEDGRLMVEGEPFQAFGLTIHKVTRKVKGHLEHDIPLPDTLNPYKAGFMEREAFIRLLDNLAGTRFNTIHAYLRLADGYELPFPEDCVAEICERGFKLVISLPFHWIFFPGFTVIEEAVRKYGSLDPLIMWVIGAEVFDGRYRVPFDLIEEVNRRVKALSPLPTTYGNMPFNNSPSPYLRCLGARPVDCTDALGYFDFTPLQLFTMSEFILLSWWMVQDNFRSLARKLLGFWFSLYNAVANLLPRSSGEYQTIDSNLGLRHLLKQQLRYADTRDKPLVVTQAGLSDNATFVAKQLKIIDELDVAGYFYWNSGNLDPNYDGNIENTKLLSVFEEPAGTGPPGDDAVGKARRRRPAMENGAADVQERAVGEGKAGKVLMGSLMVLLSFLVVPAFAFYGYLVRIVRSTWDDPDGGLPSWSGFGELVSSGAKLLLVTFAYAALPAALLIAGAALAITGGGANSVSLILICCSLALGVVFWLLFLPMMIVFSRDLSVRSALNAREVWSVFTSGVGRWVLLLFDLLFAFILAGMGVLLFGVGIFFTYPLAFYMFSHQLGTEARVMGL